jgi:hypothetical protein
MTKSTAYTVSGGMFGLVAIAAIARDDVVPGVLMFVVAIACALRANVERKRENA